MSDNPPYEPELDSEAEKIVSSIKRLESTVQALSRLKSIIRSLERKDDTVIAVVNRSAEPEIHVVVSSEEFYDEMITLNEILSPPSTDSNIKYIPETEEYKIERVFREYSINRGETI